MSSDKVKRNLSDFLIFLKENKMVKIEIIYGRENGKMKVQTRGAGKEE